MLLNQHTALLTPKVLLVSYEPHHVPTYHAWMQDEDLRTATASDPLTLPQEYAMQRAWRGDADKLTFIICTAPLCSDVMPPQPGSGTEFEDWKVWQPEHRITREDDAPERMLGDVNLFLYEESELDYDACPRDPDESCSVAQGSPGASVAGCLVGEIEIMIARRSSQGQGYGAAALHAFLWFIVKFQNLFIAEYYSSHDGGGESDVEPKVGVEGGQRRRKEDVGRQPRRRLKFLRVRIGEANQRSLRLFKNAGFAPGSDARSNYFREVELRLGLSTLERQLTQGRGNGEGRATWPPLVLRYHGD